MKRSVALALAVIMAIGLLTTGVSAAANGSFTDLGDKQYAHAIEALADAGIMIGTGHGKFSPDEPVSRSMAVTVLGRLAGVTQQETDIFDDVERNSWYSGYVGWASENGIVVGDGEGHFSPNYTITGEHMNLILERYAKVANLEGIPTVPTEGGLTRADLAMVAYYLYAKLPATPEWGANPEHDVWTVVNYSDAGTTFAVTVSANSALTEFELLFNFYGDAHKMIGHVESDGNIVNDYARVPVISFMCEGIIKAALEQNIWRPVSECPLEYVDPSAHDNDPLYIRAGVWGDDFVRANLNLNGLPCLVDDETVVAYKTTPAAQKDKGTVEMIKYTTGGADAYAYVYLPAGYNTSKEYNVLYLIHGAGENATSWFINKDDGNEGRFNDGDDISNDLGYAVNILDNMFAKGDAEPCIVVTPDISSVAIPNADNQGDFGSEMRDLIAYVDGKYSTAADREHRAMAGFSMGSITTWRGGIRDNLDLISWFSNMSGGITFDETAGAVVNETLVPVLEAGAGVGNNVNMMLNFDGVVDFALSGHVATHEALVEYAESSDILEVGVNYDFIVSDGTHDWKAWNLYLYDLLKVFFKDTSSGLPATPEWGANPEHDVWTVVNHSDMGTTFAVTVSANSDLTEFELLFNFYGDAHKMTGHVESDGSIVTDYARVPVISFMGELIFQAALEQDIWLPVSQCPLEYIDPSAHDNDPPYLQAGVWEDDFERANANLNGLPYLVDDETVETYKTTSAAQKGTVETIKYTTGGQDAYAYVYLPAGYSAAKEYSVLYLIHGGGENAASWFINKDDGNEGRFNNGDDISNDLGYAVNILDNMFANGDAEPCIVVTPDANNRDFGPILRDLIAYVDGKYSTAADREHRAMAGFSMGSMATWYGGIQDNFDNISWFVNMSGGMDFDESNAANEVRATIVPVLEAGAAAGNKVNMMLSFNGTIDMALKPHVTTHKALVEYAESSDILEVGVNYDFIVSNGSHEWKAWNLYLYDLMKVIFK